MKKSPRRAAPRARSLGLDKHWHLATDDFEIGLSEFEFAIFRVSAAFERWQADCLGCCHAGAFSGNDTAMLHVIRMHQRPKGISELARLLKRDDLANLQYGVRKLLKAGLIQKAQRTGKAKNGRSKKDVTYEVSRLGGEITNMYARFRSELLLSLIRSTQRQQDFASIASVLNMMSAMYDQASSVAATHRLGA